MFEKENVVSGPGTIVGSNVKLTGTLKDMNDITVHGQVDGEVISQKNVFITETAHIKGPISAKVITVSGRVNGSVEAAVKLEITPTGKVYGSICTRDLIIKSGAVFVGKSAMLTDEKEEKVKQEETEELKNKKTEEQKEKKEEDPKNEKSKSFWKISKKEKKDDKKDEPKYELE